MENNSDLFYAIYHNGEDRPMVRFYKNVGEAIGRFLSDIMGDFVERERKLTDEQVEDGQIYRDIHEITHIEQYYEFLDGKTFCSWGKAEEDDRFVEYAKRAK